MSRKAVLERTLGRKAAKHFLPKSVPLEIPSEFIDQVIGIELSKAHESLTTDLKARKTGNGIALFDTDKARDIELIQSHIQAFRIVARYYGIYLK